GIVRHGLGEARGDLLEALEERARVPYGFLHIALHVLGGIELWLLRQIAHARARRGPGFALKVVIHAGHDPEERRLAGAVGAEHPDLGAGVEGEPDAIEDDARRWNHLAQVFHDVDELWRHECSQEMGMKKGEWPAGVGTRGQTRGRSSNPTEPCRCLQLPLLLVPAHPFRARFEPEQREGGRSRIGERLATLGVAYDGIHVQAEIVGAKVRQMTRRLVHLRRHAVAVARLGVHEAAREEDEPVIELAPGRAPDMLERFVALPVLAPVETVHELRKGRRQWRMRHRRHDWRAISGMVAYRYV